MRSRVSMTRPIGRMRFLRRPSRNSATDFAETPASVAGLVAAREVVRAAFWAFCCRPLACPPFFAAAFRVVFEALDFDAAGLRAADLEAVDLRAVDLRAVDLRAVDFDAVDFDAVDFDAVGLRALEDERERDEALPDLPLERLDPLPVFLLPPRCCAT